MEEMETNMGPVIEEINGGKEGKRIVHSCRKVTSLRCEDFCHSGNDKVGRNSSDQQQKKEWGIFSSSLSSLLFSSRSRSCCHCQFFISQRRHVDAKRAYGHILLVMEVLAKVGRGCGKKGVGSCPHMHRPRTTKILVSRYRGDILFPPFCVIHS